MSDNVGRMLEKGFLTLFDLFEALICCCARARIQIKAAKVKFGVEKITFHNYTITAKGITPKEGLPWFGLRLGFGLRLKAGIDMDESRQGKARHEKTVHDKLRQDKIS